MSLRAQTLSGLGWTGANQALRQLLQFVTSIILARLLSPTEFGLIGMVVVFTGFAQLFIDMGFGSALIQKQDVGDRHLSSVFWLNVAVGLLLTILVMIAAPWVARFYAEPALNQITMVISLNFFFGSFAVVQRALLRKQMNFHYLFRIDTTAALLSGLIAIVLALTDWGVWSLVAKSLLNTLTFVILLWGLSSWRPRFSVDFPAIREMIGFSSNLLGFSVFNYWARNLDNLLIGRFLGSGALGIYARAYGLMLLPITQISRVVSQVMFPAMSSIQDDIGRIQRIYLRATRMIALITFPLMLGLLVVAEPFVLVILGEQWREMIPVLQILCLAGMLQSIGTTMGWIYTSLGRTDLMFRVGLIATAVRTVGFIIGLRWGVVGVAWAYMLSGYIILWYPLWSVAGGLIDLRFRDLVMNLSGVFAAAFLMATTVFLLGTVLPSAWLQWWQLLLQVAVGVIAYFILIHLGRLRAYRETREVLQEYLQPRLRRLTNSR